MVINQLPFSLCRTDVSHMPKKTTRVSSPSGVVTTIVGVSASAPSGVAAAAPPLTLGGSLVSYPSGHVMTSPLEKTVEVSLPSGSGDDTHSVGGLRSLESCDGSPSKTRQYVCPPALGPCGNVPPREDHGSLPRLGAVDDDHDVGLDLLCPLG